MNDRERQIAGMQNASQDDGWARLGCAAVGSAEPTPVLIAHHNHLVEANNKLSGVNDQMDALLLRLRGDVPANVRDNESEEEKHDGLISNLEHTSHSLHRKIDDMIEMIRTLRGYI